MAGEVCLLYGQKLFALFTEKILHQLFAFTFANTVDNFRLVIETRVSGEVIQRAGGPPFGVVRPKYDS